VDASERDRYNEAATAECESAAAEMNRWDAASGLGAVERRIAKLAVEQLTTLIPLLERAGGIESPASRAQIRRAIAKYCDLAADAVLRAAQAAKEV
jgi:hypothetical protein